MAKESMIKLRLTDAERSMIKGKAIAAGMSVSAFIRMCCDEREVPGYVPTDHSVIDGQMSFADYLSQNNVP